jgi:hypothetical protein
MRGWAKLVLLGITALGAYSVGRQSAPASNASIAAVSVPSPPAAKPVAFVAPRRLLRQPRPRPHLVLRLQPLRPVSPIRLRLLISQRLPRSSGRSRLPDRRRHRGDHRPSKPRTTGRPCACPDDTARNGRACGGRSTYSRPGGAAPLCYPSDVTAAMIDGYRQRQASR